MVFKFFIFLLEPPVFQPGKPSDFLSLWHQGLSGDQDNVWWLVFFFVFVVVVLFCLFCICFCCCFVLFYFVFCFVFVLFCFVLFCDFLFVFKFWLLISSNFFLLLIYFPAEVSSPRCL